MKADAEAGALQPRKAKGDVARFKELEGAYRQSKAVTRRRLYLEAMERVLPRVERIVVTDDGGILKMLPLGATK